MRKSKNKKTLYYTLVKAGKEIFSSVKKIDAVFEHQKYKRHQKVQLRETFK
jgi:hypothetical protein